MGAEIIDRSRPPVMPLVALGNAVKTAVSYAEAEATHEPTGIHFFVTQERQGTCENQRS